MKINVGFIGLGQMGRWMSGNLLKGGFNLAVYDIRPEAMAVVTEEGATAAASPADVARRADWIFMSLPDSDAVDRVAFGEDGILGGPRRGQVVVDLGTASCLWTRKFAAALSKHGLRFADAPVTGLEQRAREGTLTIMYGGDASLLEVIRPALSCIGRKIIPMGPVGSGQLAKMINNILYNANMAALAEVLPMAAMLGLEPEAVAEVVNSGSGRSFASEYFIPKILDGRFQDSYRLTDAYKDMAHAMQISSLHRIPLPVIQAANSTYQTALRAGWGAEDKGAMFKVYEALLGVAFRKKTKE